MAEIFSGDHGNYLRNRYCHELWKALLEHAPRCMASLRELGTEAWLTKYGLPREPYGPWAEDYLAGRVVLGWDWGDAPPPPAIPAYDPSREPMGVGGR